MKAKTYTDGVYYLVCIEEGCREPVFIKTTSYEYFNVEYGQMIYSASTEEVYGETFVEMLIRLKNTGVFDSKAFDMLTRGKFVLK